MVKGLYFHFAALFAKWVEKYEGQIKGGHFWCETVLKDKGENAERVNSMSSVCHSHRNQIFWVTKFHRINDSVIEGVYCIVLRQKTYDYGRFQALRYPCTHTISKIVS
ncbi:hypothetical protein PVK06_020094 [Gossypium arboreum]|uniref:Uncharacterized protein n=1 Tax=Gossypium arboreum TaxID=29729 RepID=A0ABR0PLW3_GOSAR|nr:hypothetical protein PVK06_020094 [Gossypium arboreum]